MFPESYFVPENYFVYRKLLCLKKVTLFTESYFVYTDSYFVYRKLLFFPKVTSIVTENDLLLYTSATLMLVAPAGMTSRSL